MKYLFICCVILILFFVQVGVAQEEPVSRNMYFGISDSKWDGGEDINSGYHFGAQLLLNLSNFSKFGIKGNYNYWNSVMGEFEDIIVKSSFSTIEVMLATRIHSPPIAKTSVFLQGGYGIQIASEKLEAGRFTGESWVGVFGYSISLGVNLGYLLLMPTVHFNPYYINWVSMSVGLEI